MVSVSALYSGSGTIGTVVEGGTTHVLAELPPLRLAERPLHSFRLAYVDD